MQPTGDREKRPWLVDSGNPIGSLKALEGTFRGHREVVVQPHAQHSPRERANTSGRKKDSKKVMTLVKDHWRSWYCLSMNYGTLVGSVSAHIAGDLRYNSTISVYVQDDSRTKIVLTETSASGGMDGPGGSSEPAVVLVLEVKTDARSIVKGIKILIDKEDGHVIKTWGTPSKKFTWKIGHEQVKGLNVANCRAALGN